jgi:hypothetical protein
MFLAYVCLVADGSQVVAQVLLQEGMAHTIQQQLAQVIQQQHLNPLDLCPPCSDPAVPARSLWPTGEDQDAAQKIRQCGRLRRRRRKATHRLSQATAQPALIPETIRLPALSPCDCMKYRYIFLKSASFWTAFSPAAL